MRSSLDSARGDRSTAGENDEALGAADSSDQLQVDGASTMIDHRSVAPSDSGLRRKMKHPLKPIRHHRSAHPLRHTWRQLCTRQAKTSMSQGQNRLLAVREKKSGL